MKKSDLLDSIVDTQAKIGQHHRRIAKLEFKIKHYELVISKLLNRIALLEKAQIPTNHDGQIGSAQLLLDGDKLRRLLGLD